MRSPYVSWHLEVSSKSLHFQSMRGGGGFRGRDDYRDGGRGGSSMFDSRMMQMYQMMMMASGMGGEIIACQPACVVLKAVFYKALAT